MAKPNHFPAAPPVSHRSLSHHPLPAELCMCCLLISPWFCPWPFSVSSQHSSQRSDPLRHKSLHAAAPQSPQCLPISFKVKSYSSPLPDISAFSPVPSLIVTPTPRIFLISPTSQFCSSCLLFFLRQTHQAVTSGPLHFSDACVQYIGRAFSLYFNSQQ